MCRNPQRWLQGKHAQWDLGFCWRFFGDDDFQVYEVRFHTGYSWIAPSGEEFRA